MAKSIRLVRVDPHSRIAGIFAAVVTPIHDDGRLDLGTLDRVVDFLLEAGTDGICVGGATSEYPHFETADRRMVIQRAAERMRDGRALLAGVGAPSMRLILDLGAAAIDAGSRALLLPMPMFFRYEQEDLQAFCVEASRSLRAPCVLYDLPDFTNGLAPSTVLALLRDEEFVSGIKDSSGREGNLQAFASARGSEPWSLLVGDDRLLHRGLQAGWDGGISGVAGFCPELLVALHRSVVDGNLAEGARLRALLDELISHLAPFPTPWGIRIGLAARGIDTGSLPLPLTPRRVRDIERFRAWLAEWMPRTGLTLTGAGARTA